MTSLERIALLIKSWQKDLDDHERIVTIRDAMMNCRTIKELHEVIASNIDFIDRVPGMWRLASNAKRRIEKLIKYKFKLTDITQLN